MLAVLEILAYSRDRRDYQVTWNGEVVADLEWLTGARPECHLDGEGMAAHVRLMRLRPFLVRGTFRGRSTLTILHAGGVGRGLAEVGPRQFTRRISAFGRHTIVGIGSSLHLTSPGTSGRRLLSLRSHGDASDREVVLSLALLEAFCAHHLAARPMKSVATAFTRVPKPGPSILPLVDPADGFQ